MGDPVAAGFVGQCARPASYGLPCDPPVGVMPMQRRGRYHALAKERTMLLRCESLEPPMILFAEKIERLGPVSSVRQTMRNGGNWRIITSGA
jgi:hypothetical protein